MQRDFIIKPILPQKTLQELLDIGFDKDYAPAVQEKYEFLTLKIFDLKPAEANILKQTALSVGTDCAVHGEVITCKIEKSDCILAGSRSQLKKIAEKLKFQPFGLKKIAEAVEKYLSPVEKTMIIREREFNFTQNSYLMAIVNVTPDSFSNPGEHFDLEHAICHTFAMIEAGADIIDIGGESTRPFSERVDPEVEISRVIPLIEKIRAADSKIVISIDTRNAKTAALALEKGADIINDVSGLDFDPNMASVAAEFSAPVIITHSQGTPENMQLNPSYENVIEEIFIWFYKKIEFAKSRSIEKIILDPGFGFGKNREHNLALLKYLHVFTALPYPLLAGISRKTFLKEFLYDTDRDTLTAHAAVNLLQNGANILRVHDIYAHKSVLKLFAALRKI